MKPSLGKGLAHPEHDELIFGEDIFLPRLSLEYPHSVSF